MASGLFDRVITFRGEPGVRCAAEAPRGMAAGFNAFLKQLGVTLRRDAESRRPRINKRGSALDREQRASGQHFALDSAA